MSRRLVTMLLAVLLAGLGTGAVFTYVKQADERAVQGKQAVSVLVAAKAIPAGTPVSQVRSGGYTKSVRMPAETVPDDVLPQLGAELSELVFSTGTQAGQLIRRTLLVPKGQQSDGILIPPGKLAVTIALDEPERVAGFLKTGSVVSVFLSGKLLKTSGKELGQPLGEARGTRILMAGVPVLAIGAAQPASRTSQEPAEPQKALVTLGVTQRQAEKLIHGSPSGLYLALQSDTSEVNESSKGVSSFTLFS